MENPDPRNLDDLIAQVQAAADSPRNRSRDNLQPRATFNLEEPIASALIHGYDANRFYSDPHFYVEQMLRQKLWRWEHFPDDEAPLSPAISASLGYYAEYTYIGMDVSFEPQGVPILQTDHPMVSSPDLRLLKPLDFNASGWMPRALRWYDDINRIVAGRLKVSFDMTFWRGCLDLAIQLRGYEGFLDDTIERPQFVHDLLKFLVEQRCRWWEGYYHYFGIKPGPAAVADDWINVPFISPSIFRDFILPRYLDIERFHGGISGVHSCGNQAPIQRYLLEIKSLHDFEVSAWTSLTQSLVNIPAEYCLWINLHPNDVLCASPAEMEAQLRAITGACQGRGYNIGTSGLTPIRNSNEEFVERIRAWTAAVKRVLNPIRQNR